jgi:hypothetical protein
MVVLARLLLVVEQFVECAVVLHRPMTTIGRSSSSLFANPEIIAPALVLELVDVQLGL